MIFPSRYTQEAKGKRMLKARGARGVWGHSPQKFLIFMALEMPFPMLFRESFNKLKYEKRLLFSNSVVYTLWQPLVQLVLVTMWIQCNILKVFFMHNSRKTMREKLLHV